MVYMPSVKYSDQNEDTVIVEDESGSMGDTDYKPTRLGGVKEAGEAHIEEKASSYPENRVGIVSYSGKARTLCPLTPVGSGKKKLLKALEKLSSGGTTNITAGLREAGKLLLDGEDSIGMDEGLMEGLSRLIFGEPAKKKDSKSSGQGNQKRIILLTDGKNRTGPSPVKTGKKIKKAGVIIDCIGIAGSPDEVGEKDLKKIASTGKNGKPRYWFIGDKGKLIKKYKELSKHIKPA
ncbi:hypothetical protein AKJ51_00690 [candidate division MSBL1 archaeon SCGC-AAA382A20]|uniref:VWFA domain-containing protein n=1 Tax=candidate division MSBL1 archaeon SCGC-AAA382A20 TaxID=1698280 RepID=A0A133VMF9_9EURY|nr:hypothetical protein AKJ51_00690 [candidate division MSBL1 archaeon SCGC-AAA382A20]